MICFYTHFDQNYRAQAATMIESLLRYCSEEIRIVCLWLGPEGSHITDYGNFPFDEKHFAVINFDSIAIFNDQRLREAKENRPWREFCWTLEPALVDAALKHDETWDFKPVDYSVYVDADSFFFNDPIERIREFMDGASIGLTPHHFPKGKEDKARTAGRFNFGFGVFKHNTIARDIVRMWFEKSLGVWEPGENDQTYLNDWPSILGNQLVELPRGFNVGPWQEVEVKEFDVETSTVPRNLLRREIPKSGLGIKGTADIGFRTLVSWHMHEFRRGSGKNSIQLGDPVEIWNRTNYPIHPTAIEHIYQPYEDSLQRWL